MNARQSAKELGALVLFSANVDRTVAFYRAIGVPLELEQHDDEGPPHYAGELSGTHFAIFQASSGSAPPFRSGGSSLPGFVVESVAASLEGVRTLGAKIRQEPELYPWGLRAVVDDPDGRAIEIFERKAS
jgi:lactoylglutathione lyase